MDLNHIRADYSIPSTYFELHGLVHRTFSGRDRIPLQNIDTGLLVVVEEGEGTLDCNGSEHPLHYGVPYAINSGHTVKITANDDTVLSLWLIAFSPHGPTGSSLEPLMETREQSVPDYRSILQKIKAIEKRRHAQATKEQIVVHIQFQKLMGMIAEETSALEQDTASHNTKANVLEIIAQLQRRYAEEITVDELAAQARISKRRFTHWFRQLTGTNLSGYMTTLRMEHAKRMLLRGERMKEVAALVGYGDEFYFNRRFKQMEGVSPGQFILNHRKKPINICAMSCLGHLLALGIRPAAVAKNLSNDHYLRKLSADIHKVNSVPLDPQEIAYLQPEFILVGSQEEYDALSTIAPTQIFSQNDHKPFELLRKLAETFGKGPEAERVIRSYNRKVQRLRPKLNGIVQSTDTFATMEIRDDSVYVFGNYWCRGAYNLYDGLGLHAPDIIQKELIDRQAYRLITEEQIQSYAGNHLFVTVVDPERYERLCSMKWWQEMPAVKQNQVYITDYSEFAVTDPISMPYQLDIQMKLLLERKNLLKLP
ncbi:MULTISPECIES: helix-turn-helix domain-containing protein [unclassified Paenibacillus]|uniref:helix-turn-helix domain-containing protein n=1 Tax=unclassified Paenibacillus TaxID=185978 RepID=UPI0024B9F5F2|nr:MULTISPECIES: helix-turn-helix domain-containing protein [unclassified Paenibacillus]